MKLHEVLQDKRVLAGDLWIRPVGWQGPYAYCIYKDELQFVPTSHGGVSANLCKIKDLIGDWEIVTTDEVLK